MTLKEGIKNNAIKKGDVIHLSGINTKDNSINEMVVRVQSVGSGLSSRDLLLIRGSCGNKNGNRGFYNESLEIYKFTRLNKKSHPEYFL